MNARRAANGGLLVVSLVLSASLAPASAQKAAKPKLPDTYKKRLDEDVVYITRPA